MISLLPKFDKPDRTLLIYHRSIRVQMPEDWAFGNYCDKFQISQRTRGLLWKSWGGEIMDVRPLFPHHKTNR
jgi:hypothetical protein